MWSATVYLRLLRITRLRARGVTHRRDQRIRLFLSGSNIDPALIRNDLRHLYARSAKRIVRDYGIEYVARDNAVPPKVLNEAHLILDPNLVEGFLESEGSGMPPSLVAGFREMMSAPALARLVELMFKQSVLPDPDHGLPELRRQLAHLPRGVGEVISGELDESARNLAGLLADPDLGNSIVDALDQLSDADVLVLRDYVLGWPDLLNGMKEAMASMPDDPDAVVIRAVTGLLSHVGRALTFKNPAMLMGFFIARTGVVPTFTETARVSNRMRPGAVLLELARRGGIVAGESNRPLLEAALKSAAVSPEHWHYWLDPTDRREPPPRAAQ
jgi:hypothetical protein